LAQGDASAAPAARIAAAAARDETDVRRSRSAKKVGARKRESAARVAKKNCTGRSKFPRESAARAPRGAARASCAASLSAR